MAEKKAKTVAGKKTGEKKKTTAPKKAAKVAKPVEPKAKPRHTKKGKAAPAKASRRSAAAKKSSASKRISYKRSEEERRIALRRSLVSKREQIVEEAKTEISKYIKGETRQLVDTALDDGDWSVVDLSEDISLRQLSAHKDTLRKIDEALRKLDEGTYGICEDCGEVISEQRLKIMPFAIYCTDCQERREELEEIERREG